MRLIDADKLIDYFYYGIDDKPIIDGISDRKIIDIIKNQPSAYSVDKVIKELEEAKHEICLSDDDLEHYQNGIDNAIEIVKAGGENDNL